MTELEHARYHLTARAILRAVRHVARGQSAELVLDVGPSDARRWVRAHPALFTGLVEGERRALSDVSL